VARLKARVIIQVFDESSDARECATDGVEALLECGVVISSAPREIRGNFETEQRNAEIVRYHLDHACLVGEALTQILIRRNLVDR